jgi:hypothetical protein
MHMFLVDETNRDFVENHFFIVGGVIFTPEQASTVTEAVAARREAAGYRPGDSLKFNTTERPDHITPSAHREIKKLVIDDLCSIGVRMIASVVLHDLCQQQTFSQRMNWSLNTVAAAYRRLLIEDRAQGAMLIDRDNDRFNHLEHLFQHGLQYKNKEVSLSDRILLLGMTINNGSHLSSAADIALGAFRYCVNTAVGAGREPVAKAMFPPLAEMMWSNGAPGPGRQIKGFGYHPRPMPFNIEAPVHERRYANLSRALNEYSLDPL